VANHTVFAVVEIKGIDLGLPGDVKDKNDVTQALLQLLKDPEFIKYTLVFLAFRFTQNVILLILCFYYFSTFIRNKLLISMGIMISVLFMGNGVVDSDLTFNTYMDITLYILAGIVIVRKLSPYWIILLTIIGALNRETSLFIPVLYFFSAFSFASWPSPKKLLMSNWKPVILTGVSVILFFLIFFSIRYYYGFQPVSSWRVSTGLPMLKLNLFSSVSIKTYMESFGVMGFTLIWAILIYPRMSSHLKLFFAVLVPLWITIHLFSGIAYQTRLFLVPVLLVLLPATLESIEQSYARHMPAKPGS